MDTTRDFSKDLYNIFILFLIGGLLYSFWASSLDKIFSLIEARPYFFVNRFFAYFIYYLIKFCLIAVAFVLLFFYALFIQSKRLSLRMQIVIALSIGVLFGLASNPGGNSFYIGKFEVFRNILLYPLIFSSATLWYHYLIERTVK